MLCSYASIFGALVFSKSAIMYLLTKLVNALKTFSYALSSFVVLPYFALTPLLSSCTTISIACFLPSQLFTQLTCVPDGILVS